MQDKIFEYDKEKVIINALRLYGVIEYDSELLELDNEPNDKLLMVTVKNDNSSEENKKESEDFKYGLCPIRFGEYFATQKNLFELMEEGKTLSFSNIDNLPLYYLTDYRNIITATEEEMRNILKEDDSLSLEEIKEKYILLQIKEIIKNMRSNKYLLIDGIDSEIFNKKIIDFLSKLLTEYVILGKIFYKSFDSMDKTNMDKSIEKYPNCNELKNINKTLK